MPTAGSSPRRARAPSPRHLRRAAARPRPARPRARALRALPRPRRRTRRHGPTDVARPSSRSSASSRYPARSFGQSSAKASGRETASRQEVVTEPEHGAALAGSRCEGVLQRAEPGRMRLERVPVRGRLGADPHACLLRIHLVPDLALRHASRERLRRERFRLEPAQVGVRDVRRRAEAIAPPAPAALLDAGDGDLELRARADEHADVEDPVLLRSDELLAVVEEHGIAGGVLDVQLRHGAPSEVSVIFRPRGSASSSVTYAAIGSRRGREGVTTTPRCSTGSPSWKVSSGIGGSPFVWKESAKKVHACHNVHALKGNTALSEHAALEEFGDNLLRHHHRRDRGVSQK